LFEKPMLRSISKYSPVFNHHDIKIIESTHKEFSSIIGAAGLVKKSIGNS